MDKKVYGIFVAGGTGTRMGSAVPKQFLEIGSKPILQMTMERFIEAIPDIRIVTVIPQKHFDTWKDICSSNTLNYPQVLVEGGLTRFHSVRNALEKVPDGAVVFIHDGVRPLVSVKLIQRMLSLMDEHRALVPVLPVVDTLKSLDQESPDPDRSSVVAAQTPQVFRSEDIKEAYRTAYDIRFTDDASVAKRKGIPLTFVEGERHNIKITTPEDLEFAGLLAGN